MKAGHSERIKKHVLTPLKCSLSLLIVTVFNICTMLLQSFGITPPKSFLLIIIINERAEKDSADFVDSKENK